MQVLCQHEEQKWEVKIYISMFIFQQASKHAHFVQKHYQAVYDTSVPTAMFYVVIEAKSLWPDVTQFSKRVHLENSHFLQFKVKH